MKTLKEIRDLRSSKNTIFHNWKWGNIYDHIKKEIKRENYGQCVGDVAIVEEKQIKESNHLLENPEITGTGRYFIICESSRGSRLFKKYIPKKVIPLFIDLLDKANANGKYREYVVNKFC